MRRSCSRDVHGLKRGTLELGSELLSCCCSVAKSCQLSATPWTVARQASLSRRFSRQEYWSGLPFPSPGDLPNSRIEPRSPALQSDSLLTELRGMPIYTLYTSILFFRFFSTIGYYTILNSWCYTVGSCLFYIQ